MRRFVVGERSMEPALIEGQALIGLLSRRARVGELRIFEHPRRPDFWLVKRVDAVEGTWSSGLGRMSVLSDDRDRPTQDSRTFGPVPIAGSYRVIWQSRRTLE